MKMAIKVALFVLVSLHAPVCSYSQEFTISADKDNLFYKGIPNPISIACFKHPCKDMVLTTDNGTPQRSPYDSCSYTLMPDRLGDITLQLKLKNGKLIGIRRFWVIKIPEPVAELSGKNTGDIRAPVLRAQIGVVAELKGFDFDAPFYVQSFSIIILRSNNTSLTMYNKGAVFTDETKGVLNKVRAGDKFIVASIKAKGPDGALRSLAPIELNVVE